MATENQYGFRDGRSTQQAIIELIDKVSMAIESNEYAIGIFLDLSKAFGTVNHAILLLIFTSARIPLFFSGGIYHITPKSTV